MNVFKYIKAFEYGTSQGSSHEIDKPLRDTTHKVRLKVVVNKLLGRKFVSDGSIESLMYMFDVSKNFNGEIIITTKKDDYVAPCQGCRQRLCICRQ
jgi:hypothetical protein